MSEVDNQSVICAACQRKFRWRPDAVGKKFKCACGVVLSVPKMPGIAKPVDAGAPAAPAPKPAPAVAAAPPPPPKAPEPPEPEEDDNTYELVDPDEAAPAPPPPPKPAAAPTKRVGPQLELKEEPEIAPVKPAAPAAGKPAAAAAPAAATPLPNLVLREDPRCPSCGGIVKKESVLCVSCGYHLQSGEKVTTEVSEDTGGGGPGGSKIKRVLGGVKGIFKKKPKDETDEESSADAKPAPKTQLSDRGRIAEERLAERNAEDAKQLRKKKFRDYLLPGILIVVGIGLAYINLTVMDEDDPASPTAAAIGIFVQLVLRVPVLFIGIIVAHKLLGVVFGPAHLAIYKLVAIAVAPGAIGGMVYYISGGGLIALLGGLLLTLILYAGLIKYLFDELDIGETINTMILISIVDRFAQWIALTLLMRYFMD